MSRQKRKLIIIYLLDLSSEQVGSVTHNSGLHTTAEWVKTGRKTGGRYHWCRDDRRQVAAAESGHLRWLRSVVWRADRLFPCGCCRVSRFVARCLGRGQTVLCKAQKERVNIGSWSGGKRQQEKKRGNLLEFLWGNFEDLLVKSCVRSSPNLTSGVLHRWHVTSSLCFVDLGCLLTLYRWSFDRFL